MFVPMPSSGPPSIGYKEAGDDLFKYSSRRSMHAPPQVTKKPRWFMEGSLPLSLRVVTPVTCFPISTFRETKNGTSGGVCVLTHMTCHALFFLVKAANESAYEIPAPPSNSGFKSPHISRCTPFDMATGSSDINKRKYSVEVRDASKPRFFGQTADNPSGSRSVFALMTSTQIPRPLFFIAVTLAPERSQVKFSAKPKSTIARISTAANTTSSSISVNPALLHVLIVPQ